MVCKSALQNYVVTLLCPGEMKLFFHVLFNKESLPNEDKLEAEDMVIMKVHCGYKLSEDFVTP
jgi:hypothetical protein